MVSSPLTLSDVLDKNPPPWAAFPIVATLLAIAICVAPALSRSRVARIGAMFLATAWALFWLWWDDWFDPEIGPQMQALLGAKAGLYATLLWIEAILPAAAVAVAIGLSASKRARLRQAERVPPPTEA